MTSDVAAAQQDKLFQENLRIVRNYDSKVPIKEFFSAILTSSPNSTDLLPKCLSIDGMKNYIQDQSFEKYHTYIKVRKYLHKK